MTRKKSNVKALALAVTCAILAGGGIGLEPVYAADALTLYKENSGNVTTSAQSGGADNTAINELTVGGVKIGSETDFTGIMVGDSSSSEYVMITKTDVHATNSLIAPTITTGLARMEQGNIIAKNSLRIGYEYDNTTKTYKNIKFAVDGSNGSFKAAGGAFNVSDSGAITADSLTLTGSYDVKQNIEEAKGRINTVENDLNTNKVDLTALQGRVNGHDTEINTLKTKTEGITRETDDSTTVDGVNFKNSAVAADGVAANKITANNFVTVGDTTNYVHMTKEGIAVSGRLYSSLETGAASVSVAEMASTRDNTNKISYNDTEGTKIDSDVIINAGKKNQVKITEGEGIVVGLDSSVVNADGVFAGGHNYTGAKAALNASDGSIKGADGKFGVDKDGALKAADEKFGVDKDGNVTTEGALKGKTLGIGTNGSEFTVDEKGAVKAAGGKVKIDENGNAQFGDTGVNITKIEGNKITTGRIETSDTLASNIGGVTLQNGQITAKGMTIDGAINLDDLTVKNKLTVGDFSVDKTGAVTDLKSINGVTVANSGTGLTIGSATIGDANPFSSTGFKVDNVGNVEAVKVTAGTITDGAGFTAAGGNVTATGTVQGKTIYDGVGAKLENGKITAQEGQIGNVAINAAGEVTGVSSIKANTFKVDEDNYLNSNGIKAKGGEIGGAKIDATTLSIGGTKLDNAEGITTNKLKIDGMTLTDTKLDTGAATFEVNGVKFNQGQVTAHADKGFVAGNSYFKQGSLIVDDNNKLEATNGLTTGKATVNGTLDVTGNATFGTAGSQTTIEGDAITTDTLKANKLILGASGAATVEVDKDGSLIAAKGKFKVDKDGALKAANGAFNVDKDGKTTFTKDADNLSSINGGNIWAKATDIADNTSSELTHNYKGLHIKGNKSGQKSAFDFDTASGIGTFTGQDSTTTTINGSVITSTKSATDIGVLDGSNLTLTNGDNKTTMSAGKATFKSDNAGEYDGTETTIDGGVITTDTLNVKRINLGKEMVNSDGTTVGSNLSIDEHGNIKAAGGNFTVAGTDKGDNKGALHNEVGNTSLDTATTGASMKYKDGGVESKVTVEANKATVAAGDKASFVANADNGGSATITGGTQTVTTTDNGTEFKNSAHNTPFEGGNATTTIINGNEITTGKITTDQLVITGQGNAHGNGSIAFGGNGTIKSDINDGNGKNTSFETKLEGVTTKVTDGTTTTENNVSAAGNSNTVTNKDATQKSEFNQGLTSIGGVVTNGTVKIAQTLDGENGNITNEVTDKDGKSSKLVQNGTGLEYTDSAKPDNATRIDSSDVSIGSATDDSKRINLSDLGQIDELDKELTDRDEYKNNPTAVGGINAEAAIRREEVARLDGRINDVNDRVNKVGAMAAAIASLKSIGYDPQAPSEFSIGLGQYKGETGVAMGFFHYPNKNFMINVSLSTAGGETMGGIGATWRFGHKSPQKLLEEQREAQAKKELAAAEKYQAAAKLAKEAQERAEYAAKLARQAQVSADNAKAAADATQAKHFG